MSERCCTVALGMFYAQDVVASLAGRLIMSGLKQNRPCTEPSCRSATRYNASIRSMTTPA
jgi:hypothetical protein